MPYRRPSLFLHISSEPNPNAYPTLWEHRLRQRRPISRNPFEPDELDEPDVILEGPIVKEPSLPHRATESENGELKEKIQQSSREDISFKKKNHDVVWGEQAPEWLNLFYDLAWTATFASLTSNNKFKAPWDTITYVTFFTIAWWIWTSQVFYSIDFYTDDWFHLLVIFLQLVIFGALAAVTRGIDVADYILHSPDAAGWVSEELDVVSPERYGANKVTDISFQAIALVLALSRLLLFIQHSRVVAYAMLTSRSKRLPLKLLIVPVSLLVSTALFFVAFAITRHHGTQPTGAKAKFYLWLVGIVVEIVAHVVRFQWEIDGEIRLRSHGSIVKRFCGITTIIIGEGINAIAGTFYAVKKAPGFGGPTGSGIACSAFIVFFLIYLYFEGVAPLQVVRRRAAWAVMHLPWLLGTILLLEGVKNQLLLSSFTSSAVHLLGQTADGLYKEYKDMEAFNSTMRPILLSAGTTLENQLQNLFDLQDRNLTASNATSMDDATYYEIFDVWFYRICMISIQNTYITYLENDTIADDVQERITQYLTNYTYTYQDYEYGYPKIMFEIVWELIKSTVTNGRYIVALSGLTFISLAGMNLIQSWPRDRFQWASITSRCAMGFAMSTLLLLNVGNQQYDDLEIPEDENRAAVFNWIDMNWVLPTIALAYGIQFIIDTALVYAAVWYSRKSRSQAAASSGAKQTNGLC